MNLRIPGIATTVRDMYPCAYCIPPAPPVVNEWKVQADAVLNMRISTYTIGRGQTELAAWEDAANRLVHDRLDGKVESRSDRVPYDAAKWRKRVQDTPVFEREPVERLATASKKAGYDVRFFTQEEIDDLRRELDREHFRGWV